MSTCNPKPKSILEETLALHIRAMKLPTPKRNYFFHPTRKWMFDFAWPEKKLAIECEGGVNPSKTIDGKTYRGRHVSPRGFSDDIVKYNAATLSGWLVLRYTYRMIEQGIAVTQIQEVLNRG